MGAGSYGAGSAGAGTYAPSASNATRLVQPWAPKLNPLSRDFVRDEDGRYVACHPVEHRAMMLLIPALTSIRSASGQGARWRDLVIDSEEVMTARFREIVTEAWRDLIAAGDVAIVTISANPQNAWGRGRIVLVWQNLRDPQNPNLRDPQNLNITTSL